MGDDEENNHPDSAASTPNSTSAPQNTAKASKDRSCPFCGQAFTSSSLGRHLDLYIRRTNPKPPDGVHDVDEIKKLRGNITRRQPRTSLKGSGRNARSSSVQREDSSEVQHRGGYRSGQHESQAAEDSAVISPANSKSVLEVRHGLKALNWQATGVINNLPPRTSSRNDDAASTSHKPRIQEMRHDAGADRSQRPEIESESMWKLQQDAELGRAAEMALREVLGSLAAAQKRTEPTTLFEGVDFYSLSFPGLCLAILPPPSTLFSPSPFPSANSWTLGAPGKRQYESLNRHLNEAITRRRNAETISDSVAFKYHAHLSGAWEHWQNMSENDCASAWSLETLRSFASSQEQNKQLRTELSLSQQRVAHLEEEYDRLSRCQLPRDYLMHPPNTLNVSRDIMREVKPAQFTSGISEFGFDVEPLLAKWRSKIRVAQRPLRMNKQSPTEVSSMYTAQPNHQLQDSILLNGSVWNVDGPLPREREIPAQRPSTYQALPSASYETPSNAGAVLTGGTYDGGYVEVDEDAEGDVDDETNTFGNHATQNALVRRQHGHVQGSMRDNEGDVGITSMPNTNGKRPYVPPPGVSGRGPTKIYKAQHDGSRV